LNGWDEEFINRIKIKRDDELLYTKKNLNIDIITFLLNSNINLLLMIIALGLYVTSNDKVWNQILDKARVLTGTETKLDAAGNPVYKLDEDGNKIVKGYVYDQDGNRLIYQGEDGNFYYALEYEVETVNTYDDTYRDIILQKLDLVKDYMNDSWGISLDALRKEVLRRTENVYNLDLKTLN